MPLARAYGLAPPCTRSQRAGQWFAFHTNHTCTKQGGITSSVATDSTCTDALYARLCSNRAKASTPRTLNTIPMNCAPMPSTVVEMFDFLGEVEKLPVRKMY